MISYTCLSHESSYPFASGPLLSLEQDSMSAAFGAGDTVPSSTGVNAGSGSNADRKMMWGTSISFDEVMDMTTYSMDTSVRVRSKSGLHFSLVARSFP